MPPWNPSSPTKFVQVSKSIVATRHSLQKLVLQPDVRCNASGVTILNRTLGLELSNMSKEIAVTTGRIVAGVFAMLMLLATSANSQTDMKQKYPKMADMDEYLMNRDAEIALARTAAPKAISKDATVLVLTSHGYETAIRGTNGFVCMVERGWTSNIDFPEIWNPKIRGADCLNPGAAHSVLPIIYKLTQMALAGDSEKERIAGIQAAFAKKELPPLEPGAMGYMMSRQSYLGDIPPSSFSHVMFFLPTRKVDSEWGGLLPHVPLGTTSFWFSDPGHEYPQAQELPPLRLMFIAVPRWSDGTSVAGN